MPKEGIVMKNKRFFLMVVVTISAFWLNMVILPCSALAAPKFAIALETGDSGRIDGASALMSFPVDFSGGRKASAEPAKEYQVASAKRFTESTPYDREHEFTQSMGRAQGYTSKEEFLAALGAGETNATNAQYREALARVGVHLFDDGALESYFAGLEWVKNTNPVSARVGRLMVDRRTGAKRLDTGSVRRDVEAGEFMLVDASRQPPWPVVFGDCGNINLEAPGAAPVVAPPVAAPTPKREVRSVVVATGYGMLASDKPKEERELSPAAYAGTTPTKEKDNTVWWVTGGLLLLGGVVAAVLLSKKSCSDDRDDPEPPPAEPPPVEPPPPEPPPPNPPPGEEHPPQRP